jgi:hypothetical protein
MRLTSTYRGYQHHVSVPRHNPLRVSTLNDILEDVAVYLGIARDRLVLELFDE